MVAKQCDLLQIQNNSLFLGSLLAALFLFSITQSTRRTEMPEDDDDCDELEGEERQETSMEKN